MGIKRENRKQAPEGEKLVGFRMPQAKYVALQDLARNENRSIASLINEALEAHFKLGTKRKPKAQKPTDR